MKKKIVVVVIGVIIGGFAMVLWNQKAQPFQVIAPKETLERSLRDSSVILLDVRTPEEYNNELGHVANAILIPVQELERRVEELQHFKGKTIIAICRSGHRSGVAAGLLAKHGFTAMNMEGGMIRWNQEHLPIVRDSKE